MIIVSGCSFCTPNLKLVDKSKITWPVWSDYLKYKEPVLNISKSGRGNDTIIRSAMDAIVSNPDVTKVIISLSQWERFSLREYNINPGIITRDGYGDIEKELMTNYSRNEKRVAAKQLYLIRKFTDKTEEILNSEQSYRIMTEDLFRDIFLLHKLCRERKIKLHIFQMLKPFNSANSKLKHVASCIYDNFYFNYLDDCKDIDLIGWPFLSYFGGEYLDMLIAKKERIGDGDAHPNRAGQIKLGEIINEKIKDYEV
jgi:hypothetical protein